MRTSRANPRPSAPRTGFTLVEMLVVIILILILATLTVALTPKIAGEQKVAKGAEQIQGMLLIAKNRAKRDQIPTGVRLIPDPNNPKHVRELQYIQQPDDFVGGADHSVPPDPLIGRMRAVGAVASMKQDPKNADFWGGFGATSPAVWPIQPGDYLELNGGGSVHRIRQVYQYRLELDSSVLHNADWTLQWRIIRRPRLLIGETPVLLAQDIVLDLTTNAPPPPPTGGYGNTLPTPNPDGSIDLMFSPSGALLNAPGSQNFIALWVRDATGDSHLIGEPLLVAIYKRTGFIAAHPVDVTGAQSTNQPYTFVTDGKSSGI
jgi:prepilin-type N-terminal cleavage/methylation domain-containing protein